MTDLNETTIDSLLDDLSGPRSEAVHRRVEDLRDEITYLAERLQALDEKISRDPGAIRLGELAELCEFCRSMSAVLAGQRKVGSEALDTLRVLVLNAEGVDHGDDIRGDVLDLLTDPNAVGPPSDFQKDGDEKDDNSSS